MKTQRYASNEQKIRLFEDLKGELRSWDVKSVAQSADVATSTIYFWLEGKTKKPRLDTIIKVAGAIGFDVALVRKVATPKLRIVK